MQDFSTPISYFPSTTLFINDGHDFLLNVLLGLDDGTAYRTFDLPEKALAYIHHKGSELTHIVDQSWPGYTQSKRCPLTDQRMDRSFAMMHAEIYNRQRFSEISVVVVDYSLPLMDGLSFCRQLDNSNIRRILLIDESDEAIAINACQVGLIDRYINKNDVNAALKIKKCIDELQWLYFKSMSEIILRLLSLTSPSCIKDPGFAQFFLKLRDDHGIVEFYLVDNSGCFLLLDENANISFLIVKLEKDIRQHYERAAKSGICGDILEKINRGDIIPGYWGPDFSTQQLTVGLDCFVSAKRLLSEQCYYYAHLKGNVLFDVCLSKILSYHSYLEELEAELFLMG